MTYISGDVFISLEFPMDNNKQYSDGVVTTKIIQ